MTREDGGKRSPDDSFDDDREPPDRGMPQIVSMIQSLARIQGRFVEADDDKRWTGSTGGGGVILEPAGTAAIRAAEATSRTRRERI